MGFLVLQPQLFIIFQPCSRKKVSLTNVMQVSFNENAFSEILLSVLKLGKNLRMVGT